MARPGSKRQIAIDLMNSNTDKPMAEVIALIAAANSLSNGAARSYYVYLAENGFATGTVDRSKAPAAPKAEKEPKAPKAKKEKKAAENKMFQGETSNEKSSEEIEKIKAANMARLKEVHGRYKQKVSKKAGEAETVEADPFAAPASMTMDEVTALV